MFNTLKHVLYFAHAPWAIMVVYFYAVPIKRKYRKAYGKQFRLSQHKWQISLLADIMYHVRDNFFISYRTFVLIKYWFRKLCIEHNVPYVEHLADTGWKKQFLA